MFTQYFILVGVGAFATLLSAIIAGGAFWFHKIIGGQDPDTRPITLAHEVTLKLNPCGFS